MAVDHNSARSNKGGVKDDGCSGVCIGDGSAKSGAVDHNSTRSNKGTVSGGSSTQGLSTTLGILKTGFTLATVIVLVAATSAAKLSSSLVVTPSYKPWSKVAISIRNAIYESSRCACMEKPALKLKNVTDRKRLDPNVQCNNMYDKKYTRS